MQLRTDRFHFGIDLCMSTWTERRARRRGTAWAKVSCEVFITNDKVNINGFILAGSAEFKAPSQYTGLSDSRLRSGFLD